MQPLNKFDENYFLKYKEKPVVLKPYDPKAQVIAEELIKTIKSWLKGLDIDVMIKGSTAYQIIGKGDIEIGIYGNEGNWDKVKTILTSKYGEPDNLENDYFRFTRSYKDFEVEIVTLKGYEGKLDRAITSFLIQNSKLLRQYEEIKLKSAFSKREYQIQKNKFFTKVAEMIPENSIIL